MKHALQKIFFLGVLASSVFFYATIFAQLSLDNYSGDALNISSDPASVSFISRGDLSPANAAYTITRPGVYTLTSAKTALGVPNISITANNVTLDLGGNTLTGGTNGIQVTGNNVTVKNGTVSGMTESGISVQGSGCRIENCDIITTVTGITLQNCNQCVVENCRVRNATQAGVSLQSTATSSVSGCEIIGVNSTTNAYGFFAKDGRNNSITGCVIKDLKTNSSNVGNEVAGIIFENEEASSSQNNTITSIVSLTTTAQAYGVLTRTSVAAALIPNQPSATATVPQITMNKKGNAAVVWVQSSLVYTSWFVKDSLSWVNTSQISNQVSTASVPQVAINEADEGIVVWVRGSRINTAYNLAGFFTVPWFGQGELSGQPATTASVPQVVIDQEGDSLAVWLQDGGAGNRVYWSSGSSDSIPVWTPPAQIQDQSAVATVPQIAMDGNGNALAVWIQSSRVYWSRYTKNSLAWNGAAQIPNQPVATATVPQIAMDQDGNAIAVWIQSSRVYWSRYDVASSLWTTPVQIQGQPSATASVPQIAMNGDGNAIAVWIQNFRVYWARYDAAAALWTIPAQIPNQLAVSATVPQIAMDSVGNAVAVWIQSSRVYWSSYDNTISAWISAALVSNQPATAASVPQIAMDQDGNALAVWIQSNGVGNRVYWARYTLGTGWVTDTFVSGVSSLDGDGVGVSALNRYVANNVCYDCDSSFTYVATNYITSQANARGVYNIDTNLTTPDQVEEIYIDQLPTIESQIDSLNYSVFDSLESMVDVPLQCADIPVRAPGTLSSAGSYCLADTINGTLSITGTDITVCMNEHTINGGQLLISGDRVMVGNGTVRNNAAASGVYVTGNNNFLQNIRSIANRTGFELQGGQNNYVSHCSAISCTREGFLMQDCTRTELAESKVQSLVGTVTLAGIKTVNGTSNTIRGCLVDGVTATNGDAYGIKGETEKNSFIVENTVNDVTATAGNAKGLALDETMWLQNTLSYQASFSTLLQSNMRMIDWVRVKPGLAYLICADENTPLSMLRIFRFAEEDSFDLVFEKKFTVRIDSVRWFQAFGNTYALIVLQQSALDTLIYLFDVSAEILLPLPNALYDYTGSDPFDATALNYNGNVYIALCGGTSPSGTEIRILSFDGNRLNLIAQQEENDYVYRLDWLVSGTRVFLATGRNVSPRIKVYEFLPQQSSTLIARGSYAGASGIDGVRWLKYGNDSYLACGFSNSNPSINVLSFNPDAGTPLNFVASIPGKTWSANPDWLVSGTTIYLADPERQGSTTNNVRILKFDPEAKSLTSFKDIPLTPNALAISTAWYTGVQGRAYLAAGLGNVAANRETLMLYGFDLIGSTTSIVQDNTVSNVQGVGISVNELSNPVLSNEVYNATTPYYPWAPYRFDPSNSYS